MSSRTSEASVGICCPRGAAGSVEEIDPDTRSLRSLLCYGALSLFNSVFGIGLSVGIPFTQSNVSVAGSIGAKAKVLDGLPSYTRDRLAGNQNFINQSTTLTVGPAEGAGLFIVGSQTGAPAIDLQIVLR